MLLESAHNFGSRTQSWEELKARKDIQTYSNIPLINMTNGVLSDLSAQCSLLPLDTRSPGSRTQSREEVRKEG